MQDEALSAHRNFSRWYAIVAVGENTRRQEARWAGVNEIVENADSSTIEALVRLAFGTRAQASTEALAEIYTAYQNDDDAFEPSSAAREMQVLAGICLAKLLELSDDTGARAALSITTASLAGARVANLPMDLPKLAEAALERRSEEVRSRPSLSAYARAELPKFDFEASVVKTRDQNWEALGPAFTMAANSVRTTLLALLKNQANAIQSIDQFVQVQDEELQMLWWLIGRHSTELDIAFENVSREMQPLVFAKELADHTVFLPGPRSIKSLLSRAGLKERKKITIPSMINAASTAWRVAIADYSDYSPVTQPIHFAIGRQVETGEENAWIANWAAVTQVDSNMQYPALLLGTLFYRERLLALFN